MTTTAPESRCVCPCARLIDAADPSPWFAADDCQAAWRTATGAIQPLQEITEASKDPATCDAAELAAVDEIAEWVSRLAGSKLRPAVPTPPAPAAAPSWAARLADRCRALWARDRQETRTP